MADCKYPEIDYAILILKDWIEYAEGCLMLEGKVKTLVERSKDYVENV